MKSKYLLLLLLFEILQVLLERELVWGGHDVGVAVGSIAVDHVHVVDRNAVHIHGGLDKTNCRLEPERYYHDFVPLQNMYKGITCAVAATILSNSRTICFKAG